MSAIDYVVRDSAGALERGSVTGQDTILVGEGADISLNLYRAHIVNYQRQGQALQITLIDGRVVVIEGFFSADGVAENRLLVSADGQMAEVDLSGGTDGIYYAQYVEADPFGKWTPDDDLYFVRGQEVQIADSGYYDEEPVGMLATPLLAGLGGWGTGLGAVGAAAAAAALLDDSGSGGGSGPMVLVTGGTGSTGTVVNEEDHADGVTIEGEGTPGTTVTVEVDGETETTTVGDDGTWEVTFPTEDIATGEYETPVTVTVTDDEGQTATVTDTLVVDTEVALSADTVEGDDIVNAVELEDGLQVTGTVEEGSTVTITIGGTTYDATVTGGTWSVTVPSADITGGEYDLDIVVSATDTHDNTTSLTHTVAVDTVTTLSMDTSTVGGDGTVNATEHASGVTLTGTAEAGATVVVTFGTVEQTVTAGSDGTWSVDYSSSQLPEGTYEATITAVSTDLAGNTATASGSFMVDTEMALTIDTDSVEGGVVNAAEAADGITITGTAEPGADVTVEMNGYTHTAIAGADGAWSVDFAASEVPTGTLGATVTASATDGSGNTETTTGTVQIDTEASVAFSSQPVEIDGVINAAEAADGVVISGTTEPGSSVMVTFGTMTAPASVDSSGNWTVTFPASAIPAGEYDVAVMAVATDSEGNTASADMSVEVDTLTDVTVSTSTVEIDGIVNHDERADGVSLTGTAEPGATVAVTFAGVTQTVTASASGAWTATYGAGDVPTGETTAAVSAVATDTAGNTATATGSVQIDTLVNRLEMTSTPGGDGVVNLEESGQPITLTGMVEQGSSVLVTLGATTLPANVAADGSWAVTFPAGTLPGGEYDATLSITATDAAGNSSTITDTVEVDTVVGDVALSAQPIEIDDVVNAMEASDGVIINGTATPGLTVTVTLGAASHQVVASPSGTWTTTFAPNEVVGGTYTADITASITDDAGNYKSVADTVDIDTEITLAWATTPLAGDGIIADAEAQAGVVLSGTVEEGSTVMVTMGSVTKAAVVSGGSWQATFSAGEIPDGETSTFVSASATDAAGNTADITGSVQIDRIVNELTVDGPVEGDDRVNSDEASDGITLTGSVEPGSTVLVTLEGTTQAATVDGAGNWVVSFDASAIPPGDYETTVTIAATDAVGNTRSITDTFQVDTEIPDAPLIESFTKGLTGIREIGVELTDDPMVVQEITDGGALNSLSYETDVNTFWGEIDFEFSQPIPDGSHLVVTSEDDTGNENSTLFVLDETGTDAVDIAASGLSLVNIGAIDLTFAEHSELSLTPESLAALSENNNELIVHGGPDDSVAMNVGAAVGSEVIGGRSYDIYTLGDDGRVIIDSEIEITPNPII